MKELLKPHPNFEPKVFEKTQDSWDSISSAVHELNKVFHLGPEDPLLGATDDVVTYKNIADAFLSKTTTTMILADKEDSSSFAGYTLAMPIGEMDPQRMAENDETAYIYTTAIVQDHRKQQLAPVLTTALIRELALKGFKFVERDVVHSSKYAQNVKSHFDQFPGSIIDSYDHEKYPENGPQTFFRIDIEKYLSQNPQ